MTEQDALDSKLDKNSKLGKLFDKWFELPRRSFVVTRLMVYVANLGVYSVVWFAVAIVGYAAAPRLRTMMLIMFGGIFLEYVLTNGPVKWMFRRRRPVKQLDGPWVKGLRRPRTSSFPSGHASAAGFMFGFTIHLPLPFFVTALLFGLPIIGSRIFLRLHHASDVLAGALWGVVLGSVFFYAFRVI